MTLASGALNSSTHVTYTEYTTKGVKMGSWSKHTGARIGLIQEAIEGDSWYCTSCREAQPVIISPMMFSVGGEEYMRVCHKCYVDGAKKYFDRKRDIDETAPYTYTFSS